MVIIPSLFKMAKNILNLILWHPKMDKKRAKITYIHRGSTNNLKKIEGSFIRGLERGFLILKDETQIPLHRVIKIQYDNEVLWLKSD